MPPRTWQPDPRFMMEASELIPPIHLPGSSMQTAIIVKRGKELPKDQILTLGVEPRALQRVKKAQHDHSNITARQGRRGHTCVRSILYCNVYSTAILLLRVVTEYHCLGWSIALRSSTLHLECILSLPLIEDLESLSSSLDTRQRLLDS